MPKLYRVLFYSGEYCDVELNREEVEQYYCNTEVKIVTPLVNQELLAWVR